MSDSVLDGCKLAINEKDTTTCYVTGVRRGDKFWGTFGRTFTDYEPSHGNLSIFFATNGEMQHAKWPNTIAGLPIVVGLTIEGGSMRIVYTGLTKTLRVDVSFNGTPIKLLSPNEVALQNAQNSRRYLIAERAWQTEHVAFHKNHVKTQIAANGPNEAWLNNQTYGLI